MIKDFSISFARVIIVQDFETVTFYVLIAGLYDQRFYWSNWVIESDYILQSWSTLKLLSNYGSLINKKLIV